MAVINQSIEFFQDQFKKPPIKLPLKQMLMAWGAVTCVWGLLSVLDYMTLREAQAKLIQAESHSQPLQRAVAELQTKLDSLGPNDAAIQSETDLRNLVMSKSRFLTSLRNAGNSHADTFSKYLGALASISADGLWLTRIQIRTPGPTFTLSGYTREAAAVPNYLSRFGDASALNQLGFRDFTVEPHPEYSQLLSFRVSTRNEE